MDAATLEETNRIRISLGMKPLPVPGAAVETPKPKETSASDSEGEPASTIETRQAKAYDNYNKVREAEAARRRREEKAAAVRKARENAQRNAVLEGKGLGDADEGNDLDAKAWLMGQKKRQKKIDKARRLEEELAAAEAAAAAAVQYTSRDLAGIKVAHDTSEFLDGDEQVLTLKDTTIGENEEEGDELENLDMREREKLSERLNLKKKKPGYNPQDDENEQGGGILAQYDEEISGKKTKNFTLDSDGAIAELSDILNQPTEKAKKLQTVSLDDIVGDGPVSSDYLQASEIKVKKPKKKKSKGTRQKPVDEDDIFPTEPPTVDSNAMDVDSKEATNKKRKVTDDIFVDDDDLQASLAIQRKNALKKRKRTRPADIAKQVKEQENEPEQDDQGEEGGLVIGEISEFVAGLSKPDDDEERKLRKAKTPMKTPEPDEDHAMGDGDDDESPVREESSAPEGLEETGVDEEKTVGQGMGAALALLKERGLVEDTREDEKFESLRDREEFLARKRLLEDELEDQARSQRERDRMSEKVNRMSVREREEWARQQNTWRDQQQSRRVAELFQSGYKPNVELKYTDDHGRPLDRKEAFKHLSHQFHGKGSGKGKTEKRLKKIEDEKRRESQSLFDASSAGMNLAAQQQLKKRREAGVRLA